MVNCLETKHLWTYAYVNFFYYFGLRNTLVKNVDLLLRQPVYIHIRNHINWNISKEIIKRWE